ncbi:50S ribosomal protein L20 [Candidatus Parcubacteria bacterium]|jgi:large subunit ribosomal protein L20|nr:MAG: 50S ribosomal protein L20 [Candidatus Parcubacteria bacterium]
MRVKRGTSHIKHRKNLLQRAKGFRWKRKSSVKLAKVAVRKAGRYAYIHRRLKKRENRRLWQIKINAAARANDLNYSKLISNLKKAKIDLDRKILAQLAEFHPEAFQKILNQAK